MTDFREINALYHHGVKGMKWGVINKAEKWHNNNYDAIKSLYEGDESTFNSKVKKMLHPNVGKKYETFSYADTTDKGRFLVHDVIMKKGNTDISKVYTFTSAYYKDENSKPYTDEEMNDFSWFERYLNRKSYSKMTPSQRAKNLSSTGPIFK